MIYKRYSAFDQLHQQLTLEFGNSIKLPALPPKRIARSLAIDFVEKRKTELEDYLRNLLAIPQVLHSEIMLAFLDVPDSVKPMLVRSLNKAAGGYDIKDASGDARDGLSSEKALMHKAPEERKVIELVNQLRNYPNKVAAIKAYETYYFDNRPRLSTEYIRMLFEGRTGADGDGGLIQVCYLTLLSLYIAYCSITSLLFRLSYLVIPLFFCSNYPSYLSLPNI